MSKPYQLLRNKMSLKSRNRAQYLAQQLREAMSLSDSYNFPKTDIFFKKRIKITITN